MITINLRDYYSWYMTDEHIEVSDEVAAELRASKLAEAAYAERVRYNKAYYSLASVQIIYELLRSQCLEFASKGGG